jgi:hypothetical protein
MQVSVSISSGTANRDSFDVIADVMAMVLSATDR